MLVNSGISNLGVNDSSKTLQYNNVSNLASVKPVYKSDSVSFNSFQKPQPPVDVPPPKDTTPFFDRPEVRLGGMILGSGLALGGIGYAIGASMGAAGMGLAIGASIGAIAPVAAIGYGLYKFFKG